MYHTSVLKNHIYTRTYMYILYTYTRISSEKSLCHRFGVSASGPTHYYIYTRSVRLHRVRTYFAFGRPSKPPFPNRFKGTQWLQDCLREDTHLRYSSTVWKLITLPVVFDRTSSFPQVGNDWTTGTWPSSLHLMMIYSTKKYRNVVQQILNARGYLLGRPFDIRHGQFPVSDLRSPRHWRHRNRRYDLLPFLTRKIRAFK